MSNTMNFSGLHTITEKPPTKNGANYQRNMETSEQPKKKKKKLHIPGQITQQQILNSQKRIQSASTRQITQILNKQSMDMISSTKIDSVSNTHFHGSPDEDVGTKNYNFNSGSPSQFSKKRDSARESSPQQPSIPQKAGTSFAETLQAEITKLRPITA